MLNMSLLEGLLIVWAAVTSIMLVLLFYRSALDAQEDDQLYLGRADNVMERERQEVLKKEKKLAPFLYGMTMLSVVLLLSVVVVWLWRGLIMT